MKLDVHTSHRTFLVVAIGAYLVLVVLVAVLPAMEMKRRYPAPERIPNALVDRGREVFVANGCIYCHTQQIRGDERLRSDVTGEIPVLRPDRRFGLDAPTRAEEYAGESPPLLGSQRTGPDLTAVGTRLPSAHWHYWHLYDPRAVSPDSNMPPLPWLFRLGDQAETGEEVVLPLEALGLPEGRRLIARPDAVALVEYLLSKTRPEATR
jgi:cytochrome c oxidase cbb3-type subunit 2